MELKVIKRNIFCAFVFLLFSAFLIIIAIPQQIEIASGLVNASDVTSSRTFPYFTALIMGLAAIAEIVMEFLRYFKLKKKEERSEKSVINFSKEILAISIFALCVIYALLFDIIGYLLSTLIISPVTLWVMGARKWQYYASVFTVGIIMYFVFQFVLKVQLP